MIQRGYFYVAGCAFSFGLITTIAKLTYDEGASPQTVVFFRILAGSLMMGVWSVMSHWKNLKKIILKSPRFSNLPLAFLVFVIGFCIAGMSLGYLSSVKYIPVSLSVLLFFTFPFWVLILNYFIDGVVVSRLNFLSFILAFFGLAICLGPSWEVLDWRGIALVLGGSLCSAGMIIGASKATKLVSMTDLVFLSNTVGVIFVGIILYLTDSFSLSQTIDGWSGIAVICILFIIGQLSLFAATKSIGSTQTSLVLNIEPLVSIGAAILLLGENLEFSQSLGVAVILLALILPSVPSGRLGFNSSKN
ncbi:MAG: DMT family transporter [SAR324 cluster bacterium]|nr:DMT family transporter [SAR324 cluster bacterium]